MEFLGDKIDITIECPYCKDSDLHTIYPNANICICGNCDQYFKIEIYASNINVKSSKL